MKLNSNIQAGVYEDAWFQVDFAAAMHKAACTPPAQNEEPPRVPPVGSRLVECSMPYVFTWVGVEGPVVRRFDELRYLLAFAEGWCELGGMLSVVSKKQFRGVSA